MKLQSLTRLAGSLAVAGFAGSFGVSAYALNCPETLDPSADYKCVFLEMGVDYNGSGQTKTDSYYELGYSGTLATSAYTFVAGPGGPTVGVGSQIIDSNKKSVINYLGLIGTPANVLALDGITTQTYTDTAASPGQKNVDTLNGPGSSTDDNLFNPNRSKISGMDFGWGLTYEYLLTGALNAGGPAYTGGFFDIFFNDWAANTSTQVLRINVTGSALNLANLSILGKASFDWTGGGTDVYGNSLGDGSNDCAAIALCAKFFNFQTSTPPEFYALDGQGIEISFVLDSNVNPPIPTTSQLIQRVGTDQPYAIRQTTLDGSIRFNQIPEPGSLALVGLSLAALGLASRRRKAS